MVNLTKENNLAELIRENKVLYLNKELINMALKSNGALNLYIRVHILKHFFIYLMETQSISEEYIHSLQSFYNSLTVIDNVMISFYENINKCRITKDVYDHYLRRFFIDDDNESEFKKDIEEIKQKLNNIVILKDEESLQNLLGHPQKYKRNEAVIILNVIYDQTPFQLNSHFKSGQIKISYVSEELKLVLRIRKNDFKENSTILIMSAPSQKSVEDGYGVNFFVPKKINPIDKETYQIIFNFGKVMHCGYYDWYLLKIKGGIYYNIEVFCDQIKKFSEGKGRFVVLNREIRDLAIHEVCCDYLLNDQNETNEEDIKKNGRRDGARSRKESNVSLGRISGIYWGIEEYNNRGTFQTLTAQLDLFQERNINCLYIMGALERDNEMTYESDDNRITSVENPGAAPLGVISRDTISNFLGGPLEFTNLVSKAKNKGIKIIIDALIKIAAANIGSQYKNLLLKYKDNNKIIQSYYFTNIDCLAYENSTMLNYRKTEAWNLFIAEIEKLINKYKISGINLVDCQTYPEIYEMDLKELTRINSNGTRVYSDLDYIHGEIVKPNKLSGFWNTDVFNKYSNPFLIKLTKNIWKKYPYFIFIGDCWTVNSDGLFSNDKSCASSDEHTFASRERLLIRCGVIPKLYSYPTTMSNLLIGSRPSKPVFPFTLQTPENPSNSSLSTQIKTWYKKIHRILPENSLVIHCSSSSFFPYPFVLYEKGVFSAADLLFFLPGVPLTFLDDRDKGAENAHRMFENKIIDECPEKRYGDLIASKMMGRVLESLKSRYKELRSIRKEHEAIKYG